MKPLFILLTALTLAFTCFNKGLAESYHQVKTDTIIINFGNSSKIVIYVDNKQDFDVMKNYDLNAMLRDLSITIDSTDQDQQVLQIQDSTGTRYLKDTTVVISARTDNENENYNQIILVQEDSLNDITVRIGKYRIKVRDHEKTVSVEKEQRYKRTRHSYNIDFGMNNYLSNGKFPDETDELYTVRPFGSWYMALSSLRKTHVSGPLFFEWGGNINWYNFKFQNDHARFIKEDGNLIFFEEGRTVRAIKSKLTATYINLSAVPVLDFSRRNNNHDLHSSYSGRGFRLGIGGYAGYRIGSHSKFVYLDSGRERDKNRDNFFLNNWRYGLRLQMGYRGLDLFFNYDLNDLFIQDRGPKLNAFSFGITI